MKKKIKLNRIADVIASKIYIRQGDLVRIISGDDKGREGVVLKVIPKKYRAIVEGINIVTKHVKPSAQNSQKGALLKIEAPVYISKLMVVDKSTGECTRIGRKLGDDGRLVRCSKKTGNFI
jgi:large subunit ribosomal protein L24